MMVFRIDTTACGAVLIGDDICVRGTNTRHPPMYVVGQITLQVYVVAAADALAHIGWINN